MFTKIFKENLRFYTIPDQFQICPYCKKKQEAKLGGFLLGFLQQYGFMSVLPHLLRSLLLSTLLSFAAPILAVGGLLTILFGISYFPGCEGLGQTGAEQILSFLSVFGSGMALQGIITIGITCAFVGSLFDLFNFYHYQNLRGH
jgi:hypothetical protein